MLRHSEHDSSPRLDCRMHLREYVLVLLYMLQNIKGTHHVELGIKGNVARIELEKLYPWDALGRMVQTLQVQLRSRQAEAWQCLPKPFEYEARPAADLKQPLYVGEIAF